MLSDWVMTTGAFVTTRSIVRAAFCCVVSKRLRFCFGMAFFPSAGYRSTATGALSSTGYVGCYWSLWPSGTYTLYLYFGGTEVYLLSYARANGFVLRCVQAFADSVSRGSSSRLRGFASGRRERCRVSVPTGIIGRCRLRGRMPGMWGFSVRLRLSVLVPVRSAFRCVVSKRLRILFRNGLLPVCRVPEQYGGNAGVRRFRRVLLVFCSVGFR